MRKVLDWIFEDRELPKDEGRLECIWLAILAIFLGAVILMWMGYN